MLFCIGHHERGGAAHPPRSPRRRHSQQSARGALRRGLPVGFLWGDEDSEIRFHPDEAVTSAIRAVFTRFAEVGSVRQVWPWFRAEGLSFPLQTHGVDGIRWVAPTYTAIHHVLTNPVYAGAYVYGKTRRERYVDPHGMIQQRVRRLPRAEWTVLLPDHHEGFIDWAPTRPIRRASAPTCIPSRTRPEGR
jgi:Recombinase